MKIKKKIRKITITALLLACISTTPVLAKAKSKDYNLTQCNAYVHAYIDFQRTSYFTTYVWANLSLGGPERDIAAAKYTLRTDVKIITNKRTLSYKNPKDSYTAVSGGWGAEYVKLTVTLDNNTKHSLKTS